MNFISRVMEILLSPKQAWVDIREESTDVTTLYTQYIMILALIPAVSTFIAMSLIGFSVLGQIVRISLLSGIVNMVIGYVAWLLMIYVIALLTDLLAPSFNAQKNPMNALKLIAYSSTPSLLGGLFVLVPILSSLLALAASLYSVYLLFQGIPVMMDVAREKALPYTAVLTIGSIVAAVLIGLASSLFA